MLKKLLVSVSISAALLATANLTMAADDATVAKLKEKLVKTFKEEPTSMKESAVKGVYEVGYGMDVIYVSSDGKYFFSGDMYDLESRTNLTEDTLSTARKKVMDAYDKTKTITFKAKDEKHVISVFTDIDCPYCVKLHNEVPELNKAGVTVQYFMYPRAGIGSPSYDKAVSVWCNEDQNAALTKAKKREEVAAKKCDNPIKDQFELGAKIGVTGTPAIVLDSGQLVPGYRPAKAMISMLNSKADAKK